MQNNVLFLLTRRKTWLFIVENQQPEEKLVEFLLLLLKVAPVQIAE
jgi:hypothetical protein